MKSFFSPASVAVVGATPNKIKGGYHIFNNLATYYGKGAVYPVNPNYDQIDGRKVYRSLSDLPERPELVIIFTPADTIPGVIEEAARLGVKRVQIQAAGFSEVGSDGARRAAAVMKIVRENDMRVWGPNCTGSVSARDLFFSPFMPAPDLRAMLIPGPVSIIAQSGMMAGGFLLQVLDGGYFGIDKVAAIGNKMDIDEVDIIRYLADEPETRIILMYLEGIARGREFLDLARFAFRQEVAGRPQGRQERGGEDGGALPHGDAGRQRRRGVGGAGPVGRHPGERLHRAHQRRQGPGDAAPPAGRIAHRPGHGHRGRGDRGGRPDQRLRPEACRPLRKDHRAAEADLPGLDAPEKPGGYLAHDGASGDQRGAADRSCRSCSRTKTSTRSSCSRLRRPSASGWISTSIRQAMDRTKKPVVSWIFGYIPSFEPFGRVLKEAGIPVYQELSQAAQVLAGLSRMSVREHPAARRATSHKGASPK